MEDILKAQVEESSFLRISDSTKMPPKSYLKNLRIKQRKFRKAVMNVKLHNNLLRVAVLLGKDQHHQILRGEVKQRRRLAFLKPLIQQIFKNRILQFSLLMVRTKKASLKEAQLCLSIRV